MILNLKKNRGRGDRKGVHTLVRNSQNVQPMELGEPMLARKEEARTGAATV